MDWIKISSFIGLIVIGWLVQFLSDKLLSVETKQIWQKPINITSKLLMGFGGAYLIMYFITRH